MPIKNNPAPSPDLPEWAALALIDAGLKPNPCNWADALFTDGAAFCVEIIVLGEGKVRALVGHPMTQRDLGMEYTGFIAGEDAFAARLGAIQERMSNAVASGLGWMDFSDEEMDEMRTSIAKKTQSS